MDLANMDICYRIINDFPWLKRAERTHYFVATKPRIAKVSDFGQLFRNAHGGWTLVWVDQHMLANIAKEMWKMVDLAVVYKGVRPECADVQPEIAGCLSGCVYALIR